MHSFCQTRFYPCMQCGWLVFHHEHCCQFQPREASPVRKDIDFFNRYSCNIRKHFPYALDMCFWSAENKIGHLQCGSNQTTPRDWKYARKNVSPYLSFCIPWNWFLRCSPHEFIPFPSWHSDCNLNYAVRGLHQLNISGCDIHNTTPYPASDSQAPNSFILSVFVALLCATFRNSFNIRKIPMRKWKCREQYASCLC